ncbi:Cholesterol oxidase [Lasiodiplodia theobromae]|uniref:Cholesterol oxidase n=1 Tax=Lasiodiplodia theobromae TaxID=45133 RepID=A0A5N5DEY6_9PEZI|nr:Cholesterol oxidase [Lasiodiplodia theobromae]
MAPSISLLDNKKGRSSPPAEDFGGGAVQPPNATRFDTQDGYPGGVNSKKVKFGDRRGMQQAAPSQTLKDRLMVGDTSFFIGREKPARPTKFPRLSKPVPLIRHEYDVVVIGSGYGGGVAASRASRAGKSVAILELGKEKWPGEYPSNLVEALPEVHVSGNAGRDSGPLIDVALGGDTGLYHLILGEGQNAFVANGLGGTSLLNANVFLECDERTLQLGNWPKEIRHQPKELDRYYQLAKDMLQPAEYPESYPHLNKLSVLEKQAIALGQKENFRRVPQTTFFKNGFNNAGVEMKASTGSGQDCTGVNDGSKNSVLMNYIPDAWNHGAEIFCECEVRYVLPDPSGKGYIVYYSWHGDERKAFKNAFHNDLMWVRAKELCVLGAGSIGSTGIMLRSKAHGLKTSQFVGQKMSGNGDILAFGYNTDETVNGIGSDKPQSERPPGPTITGVIDNRGPKTSPNVLDGHVIEEGAIPSALAPVLQAMLEACPGRIYPTHYAYVEQLRHLLSRTKNRLVGPYATGSSVNRTQTYLIMSHDSNEAILSLVDDKPYLQFFGVGRTNHVKKLNNVLAKATDAIRGTMINSPFYAAFDSNEEITVHPLGGLVMARNGEGNTGATNHFGEILKGDGDEAHEGLVCVDGAVIPTALGVNPFATITALAERTMDILAKRHKWVIDESRNGPLNLFGEPKTALPMTPDIQDADRLIQSNSTGAGVRFTEIMEGHIHIGEDIGDFQAAERVAKGRSSAARFYLSVDAFNVNDLIQHPNHAALATGTFSCAALSRDPLLVLRGEVGFFTADETVSDRSNLVYKLDMVSTEGKEFFLYGYKEVDSTMAFSVRKTWHATTTLYTTITHEQKVIGRGMLYISWRNFASELLSFGRTGGSLLQSILPTAAFLGYFARNTADYFLGPLRMLSFPHEAPYGGESKKPQPAETITLTTKDNVVVEMKVWRAQTQNALRRPILMVPGASVDEQIYALPTIKTNAVEYFLSKGHDVYIVVLRVGRTPTAKRGYTAFDARLDVKAAVEYIYKEHDNTTETKMYVICHCLGAVATSIGLLDGSITPSHINGLCASQVFFAHRFGLFNTIKSATTLLPRIYSAIAGSWFPTVTSWSPVSTSLIQRLLDQVLRFYPVGAKHELCNSTVCHRSSLAFGRLWSHENLNRATHSRLASFVDGIHMTTLTHLMRMGSHGGALDNEFNPLVTEANLLRLQGLPILFISGNKNVVYDPECTNTSYDMLRDRFGTDDYERRVLPGYGHLDSWMGVNSARDVYPIVYEHVLETSKYEVKTKGTWRE